MIQIGTSGWFYFHWDNVFYPDDLNVEKRLNYYSQFFSTVEINSTFYNLPSDSTVKNWVKKTPKNFLFSAKASRFITHQKKLLNPEETLPPFFERIDYLKKKLGPILFQLPPSFKKNLLRLEEFISYLPNHHSYVFEFRHRSWEVDETYELLHKNGISTCISHLNNYLTPLVITGPFAYIRLHGPTRAYKGSYTLAELKKWKKRFLEWEEKGISTFCYFDNDEKGYAVKDALRLKKLIHNASLT